MEQNSYYADLHNHLGMWKYVKEFDRVSDIILDRLGSGGALGVVSWASWAHEKRYKCLVEQKSEKYVKEDIDGRATMVTSRDNPNKRAFIFSALEVETNIGHFLLCGTKRDSSIMSGHDKPWRAVIEEGRKQGALIIIDHPFHHWGAGHYFEQNPNHLDLIDAIEIVNGNAYLPLFFSSYWRANKKARDFFIEVHKEKPHLGGVVFQDSHKIYGIGRNATKMLGNLNPNNLMFTLNEGIKSCTPERVYEHKYSSFWGLIEGTNHFLDNLIEISGTKLNKFGICKNPMYWFKE